MREDIVESIEQDIVDGELSMREIAVKYGVSRDQVQDIAIAFYDQAHDFDCDRDPVYSQEDVEVEADRFDDWYDQQYEIEYDW